MDERREHGAWIWRTTVDINEVLGQARDAMTVKRVFGDPYEKDGLTVIPVANVMGGAGAGGGPGAAARMAGADKGTGGDAGVEGSGGAADTGYGMGYGLRATPAGVYVIRAGEVEWKPAVDMNGVAIQRTVLAVVALLVLRSIAKTLAKR
jgi:uncharacterized spore protein YtfJ